MKSYFVSVCQYQLEQLENWNQFCKKIESFCQASVRANAKLLLLPEYFSLEICSLISEKELHEQLFSLQSFHHLFLELFSQLAKKYQLYIAAGTFPTLNAENKFYNRCYFFFPTGHFDYQDKCYLIRYEQQSQLFSTAETIKCFETALGKIAIQICYDIELPTLTQQYFQEEIDLILVPSCTETNAGLNRVKTCAKARAIEQQCYVLQSGLIGQGPYCEMIDTNVSEAGVYSPSDYGLPADGYLIKGTLGNAGLYHAEIRLRKIHSIRRKGAVSNFFDLQSMRKITLNKIRESINEHDIS